MLQHSTGLGYFDRSNPMSETVVSESPVYPSWLDRFLWRFNPTLGVSHQAIGRG